MPTHPIKSAAVVLLSIWAVVTFVLVGGATVISLLLRAWGIEVHPVPVILALYAVIFLVALVGGAGSVSER